MLFLSLFPAYRLMESMVVDSQRQAVELRADVEAERKSAAGWQKRFEEERAELKELREKYETSLKQTANFMAYAKTARMVFVPEDSNLPQPAPPVEMDQLPLRRNPQNKVAQAMKKFDQELADYLKPKSEAA